MSLGVVRLRRRVVGASHGGVILPAGSSLPLGPGKPAERVGHTDLLDIPLTLGATITHQFDFKHADKDPTMALAILGLYLKGRTKEAARLSEELETGPKKGQGKGGLEKEVAEQSRAEVFLTVGWPPGWTNSNARNDAVGFGTLESGDFSAYEEVGPGSWGFGNWFGKATPLDHQVLTLDSFRKGGEAELAEVRLVVRVTESWEEPGTPGGAVTPSIISTGRPQVGYVPS